MTSDARSLRTLAVTAGLFGAVMAAVIGTERWIVRPTFAELEAAQAIEDAQRVREAIQEQQRQLSNLLGAYATWDDAYDFAVSRDPAFLVSNFGNWTALESTSDLNLAIAFDADGQIVYRGAYDSDLRGVFEPAILEGDAAALRSFAAPTQTGLPVVLGMMDTEFGPMILAARPTLTSSALGPPRGSWVFGRLLDDSLVDGIRTGTHVPFEVASADAVERGLSDAPMNEVIAEPGGRRVVIDTLHDVSGRPIAVLRTPVREAIGDAASRTGRALISALAAGLLAVLLALTVVQRGPRELKQGSLRRAAVAVLVGLTLTGLMTVEGGLRAREAVVHDLKVEGQSLGHEVIEELAEGVAVSAAVTRFFESSAFVEPDEFERFGTVVDGRPSLRCLLWAPRVGPEGRSGVEAEVGGPLWVASADGRVDAPAAASHFPVVLERHQDRTHTLLGMDLAGDPLFRVALAEAVERAVPVAAPPRQEAGRTVSWLFEAVYDQTPDRLGRAERAAALRGVIATRVDLQAVVDVAAARLPQISLAMRLEDPGSSPPAVLAAWDLSGLSGGTLDLEASHAEAFDLGRRPIRVVTGPLAGQVTQDLDKSFVALGVAGVLATLLLALYLMAQETQRGRAEDLARSSTEALADSEARFRSVFETAPTPIVLWEPQGTILEWNRAAETLFGWGRVEVVGRPLVDVIGGAPEGRVVSAAKSGESRHCDWVTGHIQTGADGGRFVRVSLAQDVSARVSAEAERERLASDLLHAQKLESIGRLAGAVAHDFNNMLQAILVNVQIAQEDLPEDSPGRPSLDEIGQAARRSADLTRQLLAFARKQTASPKVVDLNEVVDHLQKMLRRLLREDLSLTWQPGQGLWNVRIDPGQVDQVLANLVVNARDAIRGAGTIRLRTANVVVDARHRHLPPGGAPGEYVLVEVADNGSGMSPETLARVFEPFFTTKAAGEGTGLGLATVYGIVHQNQGFVQVESTLDVGTRFFVYLPREASVLVRTADVAPARPSDGREVVLLVEDEEAILRVTERILARRGYRVLVARSLDEAMAHVTREGTRIHLLLTDVVMPGTNGRDLAERVKTVVPNIRVLFISGYTADVIAKDGLIDGSVNFLQKPFGSNELAAKVREVLDHG